MLTYFMAYVQMFWLNRYATVTAQASKIVYINKINKIIFYDSVEKSNEDIQSNKLKTYFYFKIEFKKIINT